MDFILEVLTFGAPAFLAILGAVVTLRPAPKGRILEKTYVVSFIAVGIVSVVSAVSLSQRQQKELDEKLTGGDNYVYVRADQDDLKNRRGIARIWVCSTGHMFDVKIHPYPFGVYRDDPLYVSLHFFDYEPYLGIGCRWLNLALPPGKYSFELESRNGLLGQTLEIISPKNGPYKQICAIKRDGISLPTPECHD